MGWSKFRTLVSICSIYLMLYPSNPMTACASDFDKKPPILNDIRVVVFHSYQFGFSWSDNLTEGIRSVFDSEMKEADLKFEFLDTRFNATPDYFRSLKRTFRYKYSNRKVDAVIACDDNALNFMLLHGRDIFPGVPVVFCSVSGYKPEMREKLKMTGLRESIDILGTVETALRLHPNTEEIAVILDSSATGRALKDKADESFKHFEKPVKIRYLENFTVDRLKSHVAELPKNTVVLLFIFPPDETGRVVSHEKNLERFRPHCRFPIYSVWQFYLGHGIVGGRLVNGVEEGRMAARMAMRILQGEEPSKIPLDASPVNHMFDFKQLELFGVDLNELPEDSIVVNKPFSFYQKYKRLIWTVSFVFISLIAVAFILMINIVARKRAEENLRHLNETLEKRVARRTAKLELQAQKLRRLTLELSDAENLERRRIAMVLHDDLQQHLAGTILNLRSLLSYAAAGEGVKKQVEKLETYMHEAVQKCRSLAYELDPPVLRHSGLTAGLNWLAKEMKEKHGLKVKLKNCGTSDLTLSPALVSMLFRSVKELLFNSVKHSGCDKVFVEMKKENGWMIIRVSDRGKGCDPREYIAKQESGGGFGLFSIEERLNFLGGEFKIDSAIGKGFSVTLRVPETAE